MDANGELTTIQLDRIEQSLLVAAYFRGQRDLDEIWHACTNQVVTLSLFYTGDISSDDCVERFSIRSYISKIYDEQGELREEIGRRYDCLIKLAENYPELIDFGGEIRCEPTYTACGLTKWGVDLAISLISCFPRKPEFPNWPDKRTDPE